MLLENQFIYPYPKGSKLILAAPSSHKGVLDSSLPLGRGKRRKSIFNQIGNTIMEERPIDNLLI